MYEQDTIAAIATPPGEGGVAIIRISGNEAERIAGRIFIRSQGRNGKLESHRLYHGSIHDPTSHKILDEVLIAIMRKPRSYTGEDVVEVHCHGGSFLARQILGLIFTLGARQAEPGEFTKRAFLSGKVDLTQAEAVLDLIRARTEKGASIALQQASGELSKHVIELRDDLLDIMVQIEAAIDFPEEEIELLQRQQLIGRIIRLTEILCAISNTYDWGKLFREGAKVSICGRPNVGKSSLLNALIGSERAIVTSVPGTTRDVIEESINLDGLPVILSDTAGIRHTEDLVERIGVERSRQSLDISDAALIVLDGSEPLTEDDKLLFQSIAPKKRLVAINKNDIPRRLQGEELRDWVNGATISFVSARTGAGIEQLKGTLRALLVDHQIEPSFAISNVRHRSELIRSATALALAAKTLERGHPPELAAVDLNEAVKALEEIVGAVTNNEILERIFSQFCIGK